MNGLEAVEIQFKELNEEFRIDAEYFNKAVLQYEKKASQYSPLMLLGSFLVGPFGSTLTTDSYVEKSEYRYIRGQDVGHFFLNQSEAKISKESYQALPKYHVQPTDILITVVGTLGNVAIVIDEEIKAIFSCKSTIYRADKINPFFLTAFLCSELGKRLVLRGKRGAIQEGLNVSDLKKIKVPELSVAFQEVIERVVKSAYTTKEHSKNLYLQAEQALLAELGLSGLALSTETISVRPYADSFGVSDRLDAEFYQPKYDEIDKRLRSYPKGYDTLGNHIVSIDTGEYSEAYYSKADNLKFYIRSTNIKWGQIETDDNYYVDSSKFKRIAKEGDILTARVGTIGIFGSVSKELAGSVYSDNVLCMRFPENFLPRVYTLYFNTKFNKELVDRLSRGSVQERLNQETLKDLIVPLIDIVKQNEIDINIQQAYAMKSKSIELLDIAKRAIEMAIEENEQTALDWIKAKV